MDHLCYLYLVFVMLSCLFIAALLSPAGKWLTSWFLFVMVIFSFFTFPCGILGQVWYMIVLFHDLGPLSYSQLRVFNRKKIFLLFLNQNIYYG